MILDTAGDYRAGTIKVPGNYATVMPKGFCTYNVDAPQDCKIQFTIWQLELESDFDMSTCHQHDNIFIKWGRKYSGHLCGENQAPAPVPYRQRKNLVTGISHGNSYNTGKNSFTVKFTNDGDASGSIHTDAFELEWSCANQ